MGIIDYALPEIEGVTMHRVPLAAVWREPEGLAVQVIFITGAAEIGGYHTGYCFRPLPVALDAAHDLSWRGPDAYIHPAAGDWRGVTQWRVEVVGFIEAEALDAFDAVRAMVCDGAIR